MCISVTENELTDLLLSQSKEGHIDGVLWQTPPMKLLLEVRRSTRDRLELPELHVKPLQLKSL